MKAFWKKWRHRKLHLVRRALFRGIEPKITGLLQLRLQEKISAYRAMLKNGEPLPPLLDTEFKVYSQNGEDGIILFLLAIVGWEHRRFLEIGIQDGWECNCATLARLLYWDGWFVEGDPTYAELARDLFSRDSLIQNRNVQVLNAYVTRENINALLAENDIREVDLFSLDIDGMDWWIWKEIRNFRPRVVVVEYNSAFGPEREVSVPYRTGFNRKDYHPTLLYYGASLAALAKLGREKGYRFIGCNSSGVNAFFVREDIAPDALMSAQVPEVFRENSAQRIHGSHLEQMEKIRHLELVEV